MKIQQLGHNLNNSFLNAFAQTQMQQTFNTEEFSNTQTQTHTIQIKKIGLLGELPDNITPDMWTTPQTAQKLQNWN